jgi:ArsR family transcriptional regulator
VLTQTAVLFHALGDTERLRLMELLFDGPHCVSELAAETSQSMSMISQRLKILHYAKLVQKKRSGKHIYYALSDDHIVHLLENAFEHVEETKS